MKKAFSNLNKHFERSKYKGFFEKKPMAYADPERDVFDSS